jgi:hypothetical protein
MDIERIHVLMNQLLSNMRDISRPNYDKNQRDSNHPDFSKPDKIIYKPHMSATIAYGVVEMKKLNDDSFNEIYDRVLLKLDQRVVDAKNEPDGRDNIYHVPELL